MLLPVKKPTILILVIHVSCMFCIFCGPSIDRGGHITVFVLKDPDCPSPVKQFNVVLRTDYDIWFKDIIMYT